MTDSRTAVPTTPSLVRWGHSPDADLVYRAIVIRGAQTVARIAADVGLSARRANDALAELHAIDAVTIDATRRWHGRPPDTVIERLRRRPRRILDGAEQHRRGRSVLDALIPGHSSALGYGIRQLPTRQAARERLATLVALERYEHLAMNVEQSMDDTVVRAAIPIHQMLHDRDIFTRTIGPPSVNGDDLRPELRGLPSLRSESRDSIDVPLKLFVIDRRIALFPLVPHDHDRGFLEVSQPPLVDALLAQFERQWDTATNPEEHQLPSITLTPREQNLVALLAQGHTDASAARELHIGVRSVTKILRGLMDSLHVENRFQLGLALGIMHAAHLPPARSTADTPEQ